MKRQFGIFLLLCSMLLTGRLGFASETIHSVQDEDGTTYALIRDDSGSYWVEHIGTDGNIISMSEVGNPSPDDFSGSSSKPTIADMKEIIRKHHKGTLTKQTNKHNPITQGQSSKGKGLDPIWNPGDARPAEGGVGGGSSDGKKDAGWVKGQAKKGGKKDNDDDDDDQGNSGSSTGGAPKIGQKGSLVQNEVNPNPVENQVRIQMGVLSFASQSPVQFQAMHQQGAQVALEFQHKSGANQPWATFVPGSKLNMTQGANMSMCSLSGLSAGQWRVRAKGNGTGAQWGQWTEFNVQGQGQTGASQNLMTPSGAGKAKMGSGATIK